ncbi:MAG: hypothetical protein JW993_19725 [Sedimentisphaerales bacterium]|nr:hypothetical protein [Sedimentisphaerales bacterium]
MAKHVFESTNLIAVGLLIVGIVALVSVGTEVQTSPGESPGFERYRVISEKNIFNPRRGAEERPAETLERRRLEAEAAARARIKVVGIVKRDDYLSSVAIVQIDDRLRLCRPGDVVVGMLVLDISSQEVTFEGDGGRWHAQIEPGTVGNRALTLRGEPAGVDAAPDGGLSSYADRRVPIPKAQMSRLARSGRFVVDTEGGATRGLRLTEDFMGLKEGDRVTAVGRQSLCAGRPRQRLWQMARKYAADREETLEIQVVVERGNTTLHLVLCPYS